MTDHVTSHVTGHVTSHELYDIQDTHCHVSACICREALTLVEEFRLCLTELEQEEDLPVVPVELLDPNVARIYSKSRRARVG